MVLNLEKLNNLIKKKKVEISMHTIVAHCDLERQSHNLILKKAKQIKKFKDLSSLDLTDFDVSIQINNNMISIFATNENKESISIIFLHQKH